MWGFLKECIWQNTVAVICYAVRYGPQPNEFTVSVWPLEMLKSEELSLVDETISVVMMVEVVNDFALVWLFLHGFSFLKGHTSLSRGFTQSSIIYFIPKRCLIHVNMGFLWRGFSYLMKLTLTDSSRGSSGHPYFHLEVPWTQVQHPFGSFAISIFGMCYKMVVDWNVILFQWSSFQVFYTLLEGKEQDIFAIFCIWHDNFIWAMMMMMMMMM